MWLDPATLVICESLRTSLWSKGLACLLASDLRDKLYFAPFYLRAPGNVHASLFCILIKKRTNTRFSE